RAESPRSVAPGAEWMRRGQGLRGVGSVRRPGAVGVVAVVAAVIAVAVIAVMPVPAVAPPAVVAGAAVVAGELGHQAVDPLHAAIDVASRTDVLHRPAQPV